MEAVIHLTYHGAFSLAYARPVILFYKPIKHVSFLKYRKMIHNCYIM